MVLRKITVDNSVRYNPIREKTKEEEIKPKTKKASSLLDKQDKKCSKNNKKIVKDISTGGFGILK